MFAEGKLQYEHSEKTKEDKVEFAKAVLSNLMGMRDFGTLLKKSAVKSLTVNSEGIFIELFSGIKLYINDNDYAEVPITCLCMGGYEVEEMGIVKRILDYYKEEKDFTVLDVGANVGWYSLNILKTYPWMRVFSVEPGPATFDRLKNNFMLNHLSVENLVNLGFYKENGKIDFYYVGEASGASSLVNLWEREDAQRECVEMMRLDDWAAENRVDRIDFIKCDVEGSEFFVYQGGAEMIKKCRPIIFSEMLRKWSAKFSYHPNDIIAFLGGVGYECFVIKGEGLAKIDTVTEATVETNYFFLHKEKHDKLISDLSRES